MNATTTAIQPIHSFFFSIQSGMPVLHPPLSFPDTQFKDHEGDSCHNERNEVGNEECSAPRCCHRGHTGSAICSQIRCSPDDCKNKEPLLAPVHCPFCHNVSILFA